MATGGRDSPQIAESAFTDHNGLKVPPGHLGFSGINVHVVWEHGDNLPSLVNPEHAEPA